MSNLRKWDEKTEGLLANMSLDMKIGQLNQIKYSVGDFDEVMEKVKTGQVGSLIFAGSAHAGSEPKEAVDNVERLNELQKAAIESCGIPLIFGRDVIHGHHVVFPVPLGMAATFHPALIQECYEKCAEEAAENGIHWSFAPMMDVSRDPRWGRCVEGSGEDPYLAARMGKAVIDGFQGTDHQKRESIAACAKHFVGYGAAEGGRDYNPTEIGEISLRNYYLKPFKAAVENDVATVMSAFNSISGEPMSSNKYLLDDVLRKEFGFEGFVVSDWEAVMMLEDFGTAADRKDCARQCLNAGIEMDMVDSCYINHLKELIAEGTVSMQTLDEAVARILRVKLEYGLFEHPYAEQKGYNLKEHLELSVKVAEESMVLLKNKNNLLPLRQEQKVCALGPMLDMRRDLLGIWTKDYELSYVKTFREALEESEADVIFADTSMYDNMILTAMDAEVALVFLGESAEVTGENRQMACVDIPKDQLETVKKLYALGKKVVAVLCFARATGVEELEPYCDAILYAWHAGTGMAPAAVNLLYGKSVPSGCLPMTILRKTEQIPLYYNAPRAGRPADSYYDCIYGKYCDMKETPMYPFGYGLSYTDFTYTTPVVEALPNLEEIEAGKKLSVSVTVSNTGNYDAYDTVQCYIKDEIASIARPLRELKGFEKVFLKAGESKKVTFCLGKEELGYYNRKNEFVAEAGGFEIYVGKSAYEKNMVRCVV